MQSHMIHNYPEDREDKQARLRARKARQQKNKLEKEDREVEEKRRRTGEGTIQHEGGSKRKWAQSVAGQDLPVETLHEKLLRRWRERRAEKGCN